MTNSELADAAANLDPETQAALIKALSEDPALIESILRDYGFLTEAEAGTLNQEVTDSLTDSEQSLYRMVRGLEGPKPIPKLIDEIEANHPTFTAEYGSYDDRSWINRKLNNLVTEGLIGKFRDGRTVMYTPEITEAVRHWALHNDRFVEELSSQDVDAIVTDTGMPKPEVARAITELTQ